MIDFKGHRFEKDLILLGVRWYLAYPLSYRNLEEMMAERGVEVGLAGAFEQKITVSNAFSVGKPQVSV